MGSETNKGWLLPIKAAIDGKMRPTALITRPKNPFGNWTDIDYIVREAFQVLRDETCPECGNPVWLCRSRDNNLVFKAQSDTCRAEAAKEAATGPKGKFKKLKPGERVYVTHEMRFGKPLPTREDYFKALDEEKALHNRGKPANPLE